MLFYLLLHNKLPLNLSTKNNNINYLEESGHVLAGYLCLRVPHEIEVVRLELWSHLKARLGKKSTSKLTYKVVGLRTLVLTGCWLEAFLSCLSPGPPQKAAHTIAASFPQDG